MDITLKLIDRIAFPEIVKRGRAYFHRGKVSLVAVAEDFVRASVAGSDEYIVELHGEGENLTFSCTCPYSFTGACKHVVATMLATMYHKAKLSDVVGAAPAQRGSAKHVSWVRRAAALLAPERPLDLLPAVTQPWRLAYSLSVSKTYRELYPISIRQHKDGSDAPATVVRLYSRERMDHLDVTDRLLLMSLGGGAKWSVQSGGQAGYGSTLVGLAAFNSGDRLMTADLFRALVGKEVYLAEGDHLNAKRLRVLEKPAWLKLRIEECKNGLRLSAVLDLDDTRLGFSRHSVIVTAQPLWVVVDDLLMRVENARKVDTRALQAMQTPLLIPDSDREEFVEEMFPSLVERYQVECAVPSLGTLEGEPRARLYLREIDDQLAVELRFLYGTVEVPEYARGAATFTRPNLVEHDGKTIAIVRKHSAEAELSNRLFSASLSAYLHPTGGIVYLPTIDPFEWLYGKLPELQREGYEIFGQEELKKHRMRTAAPKLGVRVSSGIDWFDLSFDVTFETSEAEFEEFMRAVKQCERFVRLSDGSYGVLPEQWIERFRRFAAVADVKEHTLHCSRAHIGMLDDVLEMANDVTTDAVFDELRKRFRNFTGVGSRALPVGFRGTLRPYQQAGYDWLHFLREFGVGGILADDMGLGKTVQALALLQSVYEEGATLPSLIVVPASPLFNWVKEIDRFTPNLCLLLYAGPARKHHRDAFSNYHLVLTSYGILRRDIETLAAQKFHYVVLDESQNIKNPISVNAQAARALQAQHKLALTGTPVENTLTDLWSQFAFLNPGMLGSERQFTEHFAKPIERFRDQAASDALKRLTYPFILRRTKETVAQELPPKVETIVYCEMSTEQKRVYELWRRYYREELLQSIESVGFQRSKIKVLEGLMRLRQVCCHPLLVDKNFKGTAGKFEAFTEMLEDILAEGHKVLLFSQFVKMLAVLRRYCDERNIAYEYLDGRTIDRKQRVERVQTDENVRLFLMSLKAGGTGLNLTAADYVILYDPWWNPAVEMQATDRTHRIGQTRQVFSYKLITRASVEEKVLALQERKRELVKSIVTTDAGFIKSLTKEDVEALFS
ncbi:MAG: serine/threonine protein kinase [Ignavibacteria bacterium]